MKSNAIAQAINQLQPTTNPVVNSLQTMGTSFPQLANTSKVVNPVVNSVQTMMNTTPAQMTPEALHNSLMTQLNSLDYQLNRLGFPGVQQYARLKAGGYSWSPNGWTGPGIGSQPASAQIQQDVNLRGGEQ